MLFTSLYRRFWCQPPPPKSVFYGFTCPAITLSLPPPPPLQVPDFCQFCGQVLGGGRRIFDSGWHCCGSDRVIRLAPRAGGGRQYPGPCSPCCCWDGACAWDFCGGVCVAAVKAFLCCGWLTMPGAQYMMLLSSIL